MQPSPLVADGLVLRRRGRTVLRDVGLTARPGECVLVTGGNGAGKSTLLRALAGVVRPAAGRVVTPPRPHAYVPEKVVLAPGVTVAAWVAALRRARRAGPADLGALLAGAGLDAALGDRPLGTLSKGQLQRVVLAEALACAPLLLVLDEPFAGLDAAARTWLAQAVAVRTDAGAVAVLTDHSGAGRTLVTPDQTVDLGHAGAPDDDARVTIVAVDADGHRHEDVVAVAERDERLRDLLARGCGIEEVRRG